MNSSDHYQRVTALTRAMIREAVRKSAVTVGRGLSIHQSGRQGVFISRR